MGRHPLSEAEVAEHRAHVVRVAEGLFAAHGFEGVTLRAIAKAVGHSHTAVYRYFSGKADIFAAARTAAYERFAERLEQVGRETHAAFERLSRLGLVYVEFALHDPDGYRLMFELKQPERSRPPHLREAEDRAFAPLLEAISACVAEGTLDGEPRELAHLFWAALHGIVSLRLAGKLTHGCRLEDLEGPMKRLIFRGGANG